ncbi:MAG: AAA family ATPase [Flavobacteriales bacterium]|nr:AAA family ATPase [Flavobacteriales bacterium]
MVHHRDALLYLIERHRHLTDEGIAALKLVLQLLGFSTRGQFALRGAALASSEHECGSERQNHRARLLRETPGTGWSAHDVVVLGLSVSNGMGGGPAFTDPVPGMCGQCANHAKRLAGQGFRRIQAADVPEGDSILVAGASGTGKSILCTQFIAEGLRQGEAAIIAVFEERPAEYASRANTFGLDLDTSRTNGKLEILYLRPLDLTVDEALFEIMKAVRRVGAKRLVIDSLAGFERALAPDFREDFEESLYRMFVALTGHGVTIMSTLMLEESFVKPPASNYSISFLTDDIIRLRYVEIDGALRKILMVSKMRGGDHSKVIREYDVTAQGIALKTGGLEGLGALTTGIPVRSALD